MISPVSVDKPLLPMHGLEGQVFGKYRVVRKLGEGGMGTVYEAVHCEIGQRAALKVLHQSVAATPGYARRFLDEARAVGAVGHPGLVKVHDFDQTADGIPFIVMEFLEGEPLSSRISQLRDRGERLSLGQVTRITRQVASALTAVHAKGIIHRDLKPENIILVADPDTAGGERTKILDFGIAKLTDGTGSHKTTAGTALGTPIYMSPEQCEGRTDITDRADSYALGVMLFEMLAGQPPFLSDSTAALMRQHIVRDPPPLPDSVPQPISALVRQLLSKTPAERPSMADLCARLDSTQTAIVQPIRDGLPLRLSPTHVALALAALLAAAGGGLWLWSTRATNATPKTTVPTTQVEAPPREPIKAPPPEQPMEKVEAGKVTPTPPPVEPVQKPAKPSGRKKPAAKDRDKDGPLRIDALPDKRRGHH